MGRVLLALVLKKAMAAGLRGGNNTIKHKTRKHRHIFKNIFLLFLTFFGDFEKIFLQRGFLFSISIVLLY